MAERRLDRSVLRRGFAILGVAIREEPRIFGIALVGSVLFGVDDGRQRLGARPGDREPHRAGLRAAATRRPGRCGAAPR